MTSAPRGSGDTPRLLRRRPGAEEADSPLAVAESPAAMPESAFESRLDLCAVFPATQTKGGDDERAESPLGDGKKSLLPPPSPSSSQPPPASPSSSQPPPASPMPTMPTLPPTATELPAAAASPASSSSVPSLGPPPRHYRRAMYSLLSHTAPEHLFAAHRARHNPVGAGGPIGSGREKRHSYAGDSSHFRYDSPGASGDAVEELAELLRESRGGRRSRTEAADRSYRAGERFWGPAEGYGSGCHFLRRPSSALDLRGCGGRGRRLRRASNGALNDILRRALRAPRAPGVPPQQPGARSGAVGAGGAGLGGAGPGGAGTGVSFCDSAAAPADGHQFCEQHEFVAADGSHSRRRLKAETWRRHSVAGVADDCRWDTCADGCGAKWSSTWNGDFYRVVDCPDCGLLDSSSSPAASSPLLKILPGNKSGLRKHSAREGGGPLCCGAPDCGGGSRCHEPLSCPVNRQKFSPRTDGDREARSTRRHGGAGEGAVDARAATPAAQRLRRYVHAREAPADTRGTTTTAESSSRHPETFSDSLPFDATVPKRRFNGRADGADAAPRKPASASCAPRQGASSLLRLFIRHSAHVLLLLSVFIHYYCYSMGRYSTSPVFQAVYPPTASFGERLQKLRAFHKNALAASTQSRALLAHNEQFRKRIDVVADNFFVGIGYGLANVIIVDTEEGLIIFDSLEGPTQMREFLTDWRDMRQQLRRGGGDGGDQGTNEKGQPKPPTSDDKELATPSADSAATHGSNPPPSTATAITPFDTWDPEKYLWGKPVLAVFYSHFHSDHVFGATAIFDAETDGSGAIASSGPPRIIAHRRVSEEMHKVFSVVAGTTYKRSMRQFGSLLTAEDDFINAGIGRRLYYDSSSANAILMPTEIWDGDRARFAIGGEEIVCYFAPGESKDQTIAWFPRRAVLFGADNVYKAFPNIYAIRGTESRDPRRWIRSLELMRGLNAETLVLGHTSIVRGRGVIAELLTSYRDVIQLIHDQTVRYMNKGFSVDDIVSLVKLPPYLEQHEFLQQFYGTVPFTIRAVFDHYVGWFSGRAEDLHRFAPGEKAVRVAALAGGPRALVEAALTALEARDVQWALELSTHATLATEKDTPLGGTARDARIVALRALAAEQPSAPARNWLLTTALEEEEERAGRGGGGAGPLDTTLAKTLDMGAGAGAAALPPTAQKPSLFSRLLHSLLPSLHSTDRRRSVKQALLVSPTQRERALESLTSALDCFKFLPVRVRAEAAFDMNDAVVFNFTDTGETVCVHFRRGVGFAARECEIAPQMTVETTDAALRAILVGRMSAAYAVTTGRLRLVPSDALAYLRLRNIFKVVEMDE